jgi:hypothetical protein
MNALIWIGEEGSGIAYFIVGVAITIIYWWRRPRSTVRPPPDQYCRISGAPTASTQPRTNTRSGEIYRPSLTITCPHSADSPMNSLTPPDKNRLRFLIRCLISITNDRHRNAAVFSKCGSKRHWTPNRERVAVKACKWKKQVLWGRCKNFR